MVRKCSNFGSYVSAMEIVESVRTKFFAALENNAPKDEVNKIIDDVMQALLNAELAERAEFEEYYQAYHTPRLDGRMEPDINVEE